MRPLRQRFHLLTVQRRIGHPTSSRGLRGGPRAPSSRTRPAHRRSRRAGDSLHRPRPSIFVQPDARSPAIVQRDASRASARPVPRPQHSNNAAPPAPSASVAATPTALLRLRRESPRMRRRGASSRRGATRSTSTTFVALEKTYGDPVVYKLGPEAEEDRARDEALGARPEVDVPPADHGPDRDRARIEGHVAGDVHEEIRQRHQAR